MDDSARKIRTLTLLIVSVALVLDLRAPAALLANLGYLYDLHWSRASESNSAEAASYWPEQTNGLFEAAVRLDPENLSASRGLIRSSVWMGELDRARALASRLPAWRIEKIDQPGGESPEFYLLRAMKLAQDGQTNAAVSMWYMAAEQLALFGRRGLTVAYKAGAEMFDDLSRSRDAIPRFLYLSGLLFWRSGDQSSAVPRLEQMLRFDDSSRSAGLAHAMLGEYYQETLGDAELALSHYRSAIERDPELVHIYGRLGELYTQQGQLESAHVLMERLSALQPKRSLSFLIGNWQLVGASVDPETLEIPGPVYVLLFWKPVHEDMVPNAVGWYRAGDHWIQIAELMNMIRNGGFEADTWTGGGVPQGFAWWKSEGAPLERFQLMWSERNGQRTKVLRLVNSAEFRRLNLYSSFYSVAPDSMLLGGAWLRGYPSLAARTLAVFRAADNEVHWGAPSGPRFLSLQVADEYAWEFRINCIVTPRDAEAVLVTISNFESESWAEFDDIFLVQLPDISQGESR
jgi:tetratricopeptide (TPR) repeat protein